MCKSWVQFVSKFTGRVMFMHHTNTNSVRGVHKTVSYTKVVSYLYIVYTSTCGLVLNLLNWSLYTLYTELIITRAFLNNLFFITNNMGVKL
jgi:hypothetical protein